MTDVTTGQGQDEVELSAADEQLLLELTERARGGGLKLTGEGGLLGKLTKMVIEGALEGELDDHLGYEKNDPAGRDGGNSRNGRRAKTVLTDTGPVEISVPRDRDSSFEPKIVARRQRRLTGAGEMVISLSAKGLTHGEIAAHLAEVYGAEVSKQTITAITDRVMEGLADWQSRPLDAVYAVIFIDAINVKIREGQVASRPIYLALGVTVDGERDVLGLWAGEHGDGDGEVLAAGLPGDQEPRHPGRADGGLRRAQGPARRGERGLGEGHRANVHRPSSAEFIQVRVEKGLGAARERPQAGLHRGVGIRGAGPVRRIQRQMGEALPGYHTAVGKRVGRIRAVPGLRPGNKDGDLHDERDRVDQRPPQEGRQRPRPLPDRAGRPEMPVPGDHEPGPDRPGPAAVDQPVEGRPERLRHHLRRPPQRGT
jgi:putative transposase